MEQIRTAEEACRFVRHGLQSRSDLLHVATVIMWTGISIFKGLALVKRRAGQLAPVVKSDETEVPGKRFQCWSQLVREV